MTRRRRVVVHGSGGPDVMRIVDDDPPSPGPGVVRVRVEAAGVAHADVLMRAGRYPGGPRPPFVPGWDVAGVVDATGHGVHPRWRGARVAALVLTGGYSSHVCVPADRLVVVPESVELTRAACLPLNYVTAFQLLHRTARVRPGERVLIHGAAGGVGTALLDLARIAGTRTLGTASTGKLAVVASYDAHPIDHTAGDVLGQVLDLTGDGVDVALDPIGGAHLAGSFRALRDGGRLVSYGFSSVAGSRWRGIRVIGQLARLTAWSAAPNGRRAALHRTSTTARRHPERVRADLTTVMDLLASGTVRPLVAEVLPLARAGDAHELIERGRVRGKILLVP